MCSPAAWWAAWWQELKDSWLDGMKIHVFFTNNVSKIRAFFPNNVSTLWRVPMVGVKGWFWLFRRSRFCWTTLISSGMECEIRSILKLKPSFCVTRAGHGTLFHPHSKRGTFCTLLSRWQRSKWELLLKVTFRGKRSLLGEFGRRLKGSKVSSLDLSSCLFFGHDDSVWQV